MYTGIVQAMLAIDSTRKQPGLLTFGIKMPKDLRADLELGASVAINGCCFTVTELQADHVQFDAIAETLDITNIKYLEQGSQVNVERSAKSDAEIGGHMLSGHIVDTAQVAAIGTTENNVRMTFKGKPAWLKYVFNKGFLAVNGCSLTVAAIDKERNEFSINLIPETLKRTNFSLLQVGDEVNIEIEQQTQVIVDTVERVMQERYPDVL
jgi:riboflavin synthase